MAHQPPSAALSAAYPGLRHGLIDRQGDRRDLADPAAGRHLGAGPFEPRPLRAARPADARPWWRRCRGASAPPPRVAAACARYPRGAADRRRRRCPHLRRAVAAVRRYRPPADRAGRAAGTAVGVLCRNHRGFVEAAVAVTKTEADLVLLNTGFAGPQLADVVAERGRLHPRPRRRVRRHGHRRRRRRRRWTRPTWPRPATSGRSPRADSSPGPHRHPHVGHHRPAEGRRRGGPTPAPSRASARVLERIPLRARDTVVVAAPLFHAWGLSHLMMGLGRNATVDRVAALRPGAPRSQLVEQPPRARARRRAGDAAAHAGPRPGRARPRRHVDAAASSPSAARPSAAGWPPRSSTASDRCSTTPTGRPRSPWPPSPRPTTSAATPPPSAGRPPGVRVEILDDDGDAAARRADRAGLRRQRRPLRRLHVGAGQGERSTGCCRRATSATSTPTAASTSTGATTT